MIRGRAYGERWKLHRWLIWIVPCLLVAAFLAFCITASGPADGLKIESVACGPAEPSTGEPRLADFRLPVMFRPGAGREGIEIECAFSRMFAEDHPAPQAVLLESFTDSVTVSVNGRSVAASELYAMRNLRYANVPALVPIPQRLLLPGKNRFQLRVAALPQRPATLGRVYAGAADDLMLFYQVRWFASAVLPTVLVGSELALAVVFALIWSGQRRESAYGWLSATLALGALHGSVLIPDFGFDMSDRSLWSMTAIWEATTALMFCRSLARGNDNRRFLLFAIPPVLLTAFYLVMPVTAFPFVVWGSMAIVGVYLFLALAPLARGALNGNPEAAILLLGFIIMFAFVMRDFVAIVSSTPGHVFLARQMYGAFIMAVVTLMTFRFVRIVRQLDETADSLLERVEAAETELQATYEKLSAQRETEIVQTERIRLMRDLHDGVGGELTSVLAQAEQKTPDTEAISLHARAALSDMRMIIGSLEDYGGDLELALASWRERAEPQLRAAGIQMDWAMKTIPLIPGLGPVQVLDVLRVVQEAVTNTVRHADASRIKISMRQVEDRICLEVADDGDSLRVGKAGNGIGNMQTRAARLGGTFEIMRENHMTVARLTMPLTLADAVREAIGSLETAVKGLAAKIDESDARADASNRRADEHRATVHRRVDELVSEVGALNSKVAHVEGELAGVTSDLADTKQVTDEVRAWKQRGIGALAIVGFGASGLTFVIQHYFDQIVAMFRG